MPGAGVANRLCRLWLVRHDSEEAAFWRSLPDDVDFVGGVVDNLRSFGPDETGQAEFILSLLEECQ